MSASEKLDAVMNGEQLIVALPYLVAVVEAAERILLSDQQATEIRALIGALSALEEALSPASLSDQAFDELEQERERIEGTFGG